MSDCLNACCSPIRGWLAGLIYETTSDQFSHKLGQGKNQHQLGAYGIPCWQGIGQQSLYGTSQSCPGYSKCSSHTYFPGKPVAWLQDPVDRHPRSLFQLCDHPTQNPVLTDKVFVIQFQLMQHFPILLFQLARPVVTSMSSCRLRRPFLFSNCWYLNSNMVSHFGFPPASTESRLQSALIFLM